MKYLLIVFVGSILLSPSFGAEKKRRLPPKADENAIQLGDLVKNNASPTVPGWKVILVQPNYPQDNFPFRTTYYTAVFLEEVLPPGSTKTPMKTHADLSWVVRLPQQNQPKVVQKAPPSEKPEKVFPPSKQTPPELKDDGVVRIGDRVKFMASPTVPSWKVTLVQPNYRWDNFPFAPDYHTAVFLEEELPEGSKEKPAKTVAELGWVRKLPGCPGALSQLPSNNSQESH